MATRRARKEAAESVVTTSVVDHLEMIAELEKVCKINSVTLGVEDRISTGTLCLDFILGGGLAPSMVTFAGGEQSAKTTTAISAMAASTNQRVEFRTLWDAEGSSGSSTDYVSNIFETMGAKCDMETLFGVKDRKGRYTQAPLVYYRDEGEMSTYFNWLSALLRRLPDKRLENDQWWYIYPNTPEMKAKYKGKYDRSMSAANNALYIPAEDGALQALIVTDSYPALNPDGMDTDDPKSGMALQAREFSKHLPRIKGRLRAKRVVVLGVNQLREKPGVNFGDPRYEPGGQALRFYSDVRCWFTARALSGVPFRPKGKGQFEEEPSISGNGNDRYRYINVKAIKNKLGIPNRDTWLRVWVSDENEQAHGLDPVWDTFYMMAVTGQIIGDRKSMTLNVHGLGQAKRPIDWLTFKKLIIGSPEQKTAICTKLGYNPINLRKGLFARLRKGVLEELYAVHRNKGPAAAKPTRDDVDEDDDEGDEE